MPYENCNGLETILVKYPVIQPIYELNKSMIPLEPTPRPTVKLQDIEVEEPSKPPEELPPISIFLFKTSATDEVPPVPEKESEEPKPEETKPEETKPEETKPEEEPKPKKNQT